MLFGGRGRGLALACALCWLLSLAYASSARAAAYGTISGSVTDASSHLAIEGISVCVTSTEFEFESESEEAEEHAFGCAKSGADGSYSVPELRSGSYTVQFSSPPEGALDYARQFYDGKVLPSEAEAVSVSAEATTAGIDAELAPGAEIAGTVTEAAGGAPVTKGEVCALRPTGAPGGVETVGCALIGAGGNYTIRGLPSGAYKVAFEVPGFAVAFFNDRAFEAEAEAVSVSAPGLTQGIDAAMRPRTGSSAAPGAPVPVTTTPATTAPRSTKAPALPRRASKTKHPKRKRRSTKPRRANRSPKKAPLEPRSKLVLTSTQIVVTHAGVALVGLECAGQGACRGRVTLTDGQTPRTGGTSARARSALAPSALLSLSGGHQLTARLKLNVLARELLRAGNGHLVLEVVIETFTT